MKIAMEIEKFSIKIDKEVTKKYWGELIEEVQNDCMCMHHWKDDTGYTSTEKDFRDYIKRLKKELKSLE